MIRAEDSKIVHPSELWSTVDSGTKLEMSIVIWQGTANPKKCPMCGHINSQLAVNIAWIEWQVPPVYLHADNQHFNYYSCHCRRPFLVAEADPNSQSEDVENSGQGGAARGNKEIFSPAAYVTAYFA